jgi:hypothetical protein
MMANYFMKWPTRYSRADGAFGRPVQTAPPEVDEGHIEVAAGTSTYMLCQTRRRVSPSASEDRSAIAQRRGWRDWNNCAPGGGLAVGPLMTVPRTSSFIRRFLRTGDHHMHRTSIGVKTVFEGNQPLPDPAPRGLSTWNLVDTTFLKAWPLV